MHSHNYTLRQFYKRQFGEGRAEARIFEWTSWERSVIRYSFLPYLRQVAGDWKYCLTRLQLAEAIYSPVLRLAQLAGRRQGFSSALRELKNSS
jgi:rhamnosyltransferase